MIKYGAIVSPWRILVVEKMSVGPFAVSAKVCGFSYILLMTAIIFSGIQYMDII